MTYHNEVDWELSRDASLRELVEKNKEKYGFILYGGKELKDGTVQTIFQC